MCDSPRLQRQTKVCSLAPMYVFRILLRKVAHVPCRRPELLLSFSANPTPPDSTPLCVRLRLSVPSHTAHSHHPPPRPSPSPSPSATHPLLPLTRRLPRKHTLLPHLSQKKNVFTLSPPPFSPSRSPVPVTPLPLHAFSRYPLLLPSTPHPFQTWWMSRPTVPRVAFDLPEC